MSSAECLIVLNPDIAGIGIRLSLYILSLAGPIVAVFASSKEFLRAVERSLGVTGLAVLLTSFISAGARTLDLFHALCVVHLVGLTGFSIQPSLKGKRSNRVSQVTTFGLFYLALSGFCVFVIYLFATATRFGPNPGCNHRTLYVLFGFSVSATNYEFRWLFIAAIIFLLVGVLLSSLCGMRMDMDIDDSDSLTVGGMNYVSFLGDIAGRAYIIAMLELIIQRNNASTAGTGWSFGQILAMMMLIGPLVELTSLFTSSKSDLGEAFGMSEIQEAAALQLLIHFGLSILDLAFNAAAGAAAAATGAHVNGSPYNGQIVQLGALAGVIKSGILNYSLLVSSASSGSVSLGVMFTTSTFGMAFIVTLAMTQKTIATTPDQLLIGALAAGAPLTAGGALAGAGSGVGAYLPFNAGFDALAGYTFARVAHNHGFDVCSFKAAAAAGAVFGVLIWIFKLPISCLEQAQQSSENSTYNSFPMTLL